MRCLDYTIEFPKITFGLPSCEELTKRGSEFVHDQTQQLIQSKKQLEAKAQNVKEEVTKAAE